MDTIQLDGVVPNQTPLARRTIARVSKRSRWIWSRVSGRLCGVCFPLLSLYTNQIGMDLDWANDCLWFILVPLIGINTVIIVAKLIWWSEFCRFLVARFYPFQNKNSGLSYYKYTDEKIRALIHSIGCLVLVLMFLRILSDDVYMLGVRHDQQSTGYKQNTVLDIWARGGRHRSWFSASNVMIARSIIGILHHRLVVMMALFSIYNTPTKHSTHK